MLSRASSRPWCAPRRLTFRWLFHVSRSYNISYMQGSWPWLAMPSALTLAPGRTCPFKPTQSPWVIPMGPQLDLPLKLFLELIIWISILSVYKWTFQAGPYRSGICMSWYQPQAAEYGELMVRSSQTASCSLLLFYCMSFFYTIMFFYVVLELRTWMPWIVVMWVIDQLCEMLDADNLSYDLSDDQKF